MNENRNHLTEDQLMDSVSGCINDVIRKHIEDCEQCRKEINELIEIQKTLQDVDDEEIPSHVERKIFKSINKPKSINGVSLLENPLLVIIITIFMLLFFYFILGSMLF